MGEECLNIPSPITPTLGEPNNNSVKERSV